MKVAVFVALLALVALAAAVASPKLTMGKFPRKHLSMEHASMLASGRGVPLKGNIPNYGEYVLATALLSRLYAFCELLYPIRRCLERRERLGPPKSGYLSLEVSSNLSDCHGALPPCLPGLAIAHLALIWRMLTEMNLFLVQVLR